MKCIYQLFLISLLVFFNFSCTNKPTREPATESFKYLPKTVEVLKAAAAQGVLFQISTSTQRDVESVQADEQCKKLVEPKWAQKTLYYLEELKNNPNLYSRFHIFEIKRGDEPKVDLNSDLDGVVTLSIQYSKKETRRKINFLSDVPCNENPNFWLDKDLTIAEFNYPSKEELRQFLNNSPPKAQIEKMEYPNDFLNFLAERAAIFVYNPSLGFEKNLNGQSLIKVFLSEMSLQVRKEKKYGYIDFWMHEIGSKSKQAEMLKLFYLKNEVELSLGIHVESEGKFARKVKKNLDITSFFVSYKNTGEEFIYKGLPELNLCLGDLSKDYKNIFSLDKKFELSPEGFLHPGYSCNQ